MARQTGQRILGVVENMAPLMLPDGTVLDLFGSGGGEAVAAGLSDEDGPVPLLASIPLSQGLRAAGDAGAPVVVTDPDDPAARAIEALADRVTAAGRGLAGRPLAIRPR